MSKARHPGYTRADLIANGPGQKGLIWQISRLLQPIMSPSTANGALPTLYAVTCPEPKKAAYNGPEVFLETKGVTAASRVTRRQKRINGLLA